VNVQFSIDGSPFGDVVALANGTATSGVVSTLSATGNMITFAYAGDSNYKDNDNTSSPFTQTVNKAAIASAVTSADNPTVYNVPATFYITVGAVAPGAGTPSGTVNVMGGSTQLGTVDLSRGTAFYTTD